MSFTREKHLAWIVNDCPAPVAIKALFVTDAATKHDHFDYVLPFYGPKDDGSVEQTERDLGMWKGWSKVCMAARLEPQATWFAAFLLSGGHLQCKIYPDPKDTSYVQEMESLDIYTKFRFVGFRVSMTFEQERGTKSHCGRFHLEKVGVRDAPKELVDFAIRNGIIKSDDVLSWADVEQINPKRVTKGYELKVLEGFFDTCPQDVGIQCDPGDLE